MGVKKAGAKWAAAVDLQPMFPKPDEPESMSLRREGVTPTQTVGADLNL